MTPTAPYATLEGPIQEGHLLVSLDPWQLHCAQKAFEEHGPAHGIAFVRCQLNEGYYSPAPYVQGSSRGGSIKILSCDRNPGGGERGHLTIFDYDELKPEVREALHATLKEGGLELVVRK